LATPSKEYPFEIRKGPNTGEKKRVTWAALNLVQNGDTIFLPEGTTTQEFAKLLPSHRRITVITNALRVLALLEFVVQPRLVESQESLAGLYEDNPKRTTATLAGGNFAGTEVAHLLDCCQHWRVN